MQVVMIHSRVLPSRILNSSLPSLWAVPNPPIVTSPISIISPTFHNNIRNFSSAKGLFNTKKIRRQPKLLISEADDDCNKILQTNNDDSRKNEYSDKFMKGEVSVCQCFSCCSTMFFCVPFTNGLEFFMK